MLSERKQTHKKVYIGWLYFYEILLQQNYSVETEIKAVAASFGDGEELAGKGHQETFSGGGNVNLDGSSRYVELYICQIL